MSVKEYNKSLIITDCQNGQVLDVIPCDLYNETTLHFMLNDILEEYLLGNEHGIMIKFGCKS